MLSCDGTDPAGDVRVHGTRDVPRTARFVLFSAVCPPGNGGAGPRTFFGYSLEERGSGSGGGGDARVQSGVPRRLAELDVGGVRANSGRFVYVHGRVHDRAVTAVEAAFAGGETLRDDATDGSFALISTTSAGPCEVRFLDERGGVLGEATLAGTTPPGVVPPNASSAWSGSEATRESCGPAGDATRAVE